MRRILTAWLALTALLMLLSYLTKPYLDVYSDADNDFARSLAGEMLAELEQIQRGNDDASGPASLDRLAGGEGRFGEWKHAATHFKGRLAEDFVYAFALAEEGCRLSAATRDEPDGDRRRRARELLRRAGEEFRRIAAKDYRQGCRKGRE